MNDQQNMEQWESRAKAADNQMADAAEGGEKSANQSDAAQLQVDLDEKKRELEEVNNRLLRLQADFDNFRRRSRQEKEEVSQIIANNIFTQLLPVLDNFERALETGSNQDTAQLLAGMELIYRQFVQIMECFGITALEAVGCQFNPSEHEAVMRVEDPSQPDGLVVEQLQKGYKTQTKLLRPCMVKVVCNS